MKSMRVKPRTRFVPVLAMFVAIAWVSPAHATFPGKNGRIVFNLPPDVYTMNPDGSDVRQLTAYTDGTFIDAPAYSPDGKQIIFVVLPQGDSSSGQLWVMNADGSNPHRLFSDEPGFGDFQPDFSPDGKQVLLTRCGPVNCAIYRVQADGTGLTAITPFNFNEDIFDVISRYSPDGDTIAFGSFSRGGILGAIYTMSADGSDIHRLTPAVTGAIVSDWSPDGKKLAVDSHCCNPQLSSLFVIHEDGSGISQVTFDGGTFVDDGASWSPQGDAIVFQRQNVKTGANGIYVLSSDGQQIRLILERPASAFRPLRPKQIKNLSRMPGQKSLIEIENGGFQPRWGVAQ